MASIDLPFNNNLIKKIKLKVQFFIKLAKGTKIPGKLIDFLPGFLERRDFSSSMLHSMADAAGIFSIFASL